MNDAESEHDAACGGAVQKRGDAQSRLCSRSYRGASPAICARTLLLMLAVSSYAVCPAAGENATITIATWNIQVLGQSKSGNATMMDRIFSYLTQYDIVFVQEIRDAANGTYDKLCRGMGPLYACVLSTRAGRSTSKEQYGLFYRTAKAKVVALKDYNPDSSDRWERPPLKATFELGGNVVSGGVVSKQNVSLWNIHVKPDDVVNELAALERAARRLMNKEATVLLGDMNADCGYYNPATQTEFDSWRWVVGDADDTTEAASSCAYDRIIINPLAEAFYKSYGIVSDGMDKALSDHYLVWASFQLPIEATPAPDTSAPPTAAPPTPEPAPLFGPTPSPATGAPSTGMPDPTATQPTTAPTALPATPNPIPATGVPQGKPANETPSPGAGGGGGGGGNNGGGSEAPATPAGVVATQIPGTLSPDATDAPTDTPTAQPTGAGGLGRSEPVTEAPEEGGGSDKWLAIGLSLGIVAAIAIAAVVTVFLKTRKEKVKMSINSYDAVTPHELEEQMSCSSYYGGGAVPPPHASHNHVTL